MGYLFGQKRREVGRLQRQAARCFLVTREADSVEARHTQPPLEADAVAVAHDQHSDHELRVDRRSTDVAIERCQLLAQVSQHLHYDRIDPAQEMARRNAPFEVEQIEQLALIARLPTHHGKPPPLNVSSDGITVRRKSRALFQQYRSDSVIRAMSAARPL